MQLITKHNSLSNNLNRVISMFLNDKLALFQLFF